MKETFNERICRLWDDAEDDFPDKSTEFLMQIVCDRYCMETNQDIDNADIAVALAEAEDND